MSENNIRYFYINLGKIIEPKIKKNKKDKTKKSFNNANTVGLDMRRIKNGFDS